MKRLLIGLAVASLAALSLIPPAAAAADPPVTHKLTGYVVTVDEPPDTTATGCPPGAVWRYTAIGTATLSHLGPSHVVMTHCSYMAGPTATAGTFDSGTTTITADNGDTLRMSHSGTFVLRMEAGALISVPHVHWTIIGGTGRFAHATGSGHTYAQSTDIFTPPTITSGSLVGTIAYTASDRRS